MEEKPPNKIIPLEKNTFKDILISADNDDVIIPVSSTYDKAVLHIGIGNKRGIIIEKPNEENVKTSVRYATRKFSEYRYKRSNKDRGVMDSKDEDYGNQPQIEIHKKLNNDLRNEKEIVRQLLQMNSSKLPIEIRKARRSLSESEIQGQSVSKNDKDDIDQIKTAMDTKSSSDMNIVSQPEFRYEKKTAGVPKVGRVVDSQVLAKANADIVVDNLTKTIFEALLAKSSVKQACDAIDKAYDNEMLAIANGPERVYLDSFQSESGTSEPLYSKVTLGEAIIRHEEIKREQESDQPDATVDKRSLDTVSNRDPPDAFVNKRSLDAVSKNDPSDVIVEKRSLDSVSNSDPPDVIVEKRTLDSVCKSNPHDVIVENRSLHSLSNSDPSDVIVDKRSLDIASYSDPPDIIVEQRLLDIISHNDPPDAIWNNRSYDTILYSDPPDAIYDNRSIDTISYSDPFDAIWDNRSYDTISYNDPPDSIWDNRSFDTISYSYSPDAVVDKNSLEAISYSNPSNTILIMFLLIMVDIIDDAPSYSDVYDTIVETGSLDTYTNSHSDPFVAIVDKGSDDALSDSDTLDEIDDIDPDDAIKEEKVLIDQDEVASVCDIDDIVVEEDVTDAHGTTNDDGETDDNVFTDTNDDTAADYNVPDDDDSLFGIMNIYTDSDVHYDLNKTPVVDYCTDQKTDFGYQLFSLSTFFKS